MCRGLLIPDTILGGNMTSEEVFNDKTKWISWNTYPLKDKSNISCQEDNLVVL